MIEQKNYLNGKSSGVSVNDVDDPKLNVDSIQTDSSVGLGLAVHKPDERGQARHVEPGSQRPSSRRRVRINFRHHSLTTERSKLRRGCCKLWSKRFANDKIALLSVEIHKCVLVAVHNLVEVLRFEGDVTYRGRNLNCVQSKRD